MYQGDIRLGDTIDIKFTSRNFTTGAPFTLAGSPVISAYVGNGTTEITAGITLTVDFDSRTGLNNIRVVATSGNGFATATNVQLVITTGTVNSVSVVGEVVASFSIENRSALMPTTGGRTATVNAGGDVDVNVTKLLGTAWLAPGTAGTPDVNVKLWNALATVALPLVPTTAGRTLDVTAANKVNGVVLVDTVTTYTGDTPQTGDNFARLGAPAGASVSADVAAVKAETATILTDTNDIQTRLPAALTGGKMESNLGSITAGVIAAASFAAGAFDAVWTVAARTLTSFDTLVVDVATAVWGAATRVLTAATNITSTGGTTVPQTGDSFARLGAPAGASVSADLAAVKAVVDAILTDTGTTLDAKIDAIKAVTDLLPNAGALLNLDAAISSRLAAASYTAPPSAATNASTLLGSAVEGAVTVVQSLRLANSANGGKLSGAATANVLIRDLGDSKNRVDAVVDASGNRVTVTRDLT